MTEVGELSLPALSLTVRSWFDKLIMSGLRRRMRIMERPWDKPRDLSKVFDRHQMPLILILSKDAYLRGLWFSRLNMGRGK